MLVQRRRKPVLRIRRPPSCPIPGSPASAEPLPPKQGRGGVSGLGRDTRQVLAGVSGGAAATHSSHLVRRGQGVSHLPGALLDFWVQTDRSRPYPHGADIPAMEHARKQADECATQAFSLTSLSCEKRGGEGRGPSRKPAHTHPVPPHARPAQAGSPLESHCVPFQGQEERAGHMTSGRRRWTRRLRPANIKETVEGVLGVCIQSSVQAPHSGPCLSRGIHGRPSCGLRF